MTVGALSAVPLARFLGIGATLLLASVLLPIAPFDGRHITNRWIGLCSAALLGLATVAIALSWV